MSKGRFHKMHGLGNDFVIIDARVDDLIITNVMASNIANRHNGIGCDQLIILKPSTKADVRMQIFNADGGEVEACGNASRCVVALLGDDITIETSGGLLSGTNSHGNPTVNMGAPQFEWDIIPLAYAMDSLSMPIGWEGLDSPTAVNVGNPHVVFFVDDADKVELDRLGPQIEVDPVFPERVNVNVASRTENGLKLHVWERGVGLTKACGTGACATAVAAIKRGLASSPISITLPGGELSISWEEGGPIMMSGPATYVFEGETDWSSFR
ncbi:MAG: diaminopimelate epimerase [Parasphingorhabdus sp.]